MSYLKKFKEQLPSKQKFYSYLASNTISGKEYKHILKVWNRFDKKKKDERLSPLVLKVQRFIVS